MTHLALKQQAALALLIALVSATSTFSQPSPAAPAVVPTTTWSHQIAPILYNNCTTCHHPGGAGPFSLLALAGGGSATLAATGATIDGDAEVAQQFSELLGLLKPDPEEELAQLLGDAPAHHLGRVARAAVDFGNRVAHTTVQNVAEYLAHERRDLVPRAEGRQLLDGIDALRDDVDRFEARLNHLAQRLSRTTS